MEDLVETLVTGFVLSVVFIGIAWWFWRRYDRPSEAQLEREEELAKKKQEQEMWRAVEAQMAEEKAAMEEQAIYLRKKAEQNQRAQPPAAGALTNALEAFSEPSKEVEVDQDMPSFEGKIKAPKDGVSLNETDLEDADDLDVLLASSPVAVRQDSGVVSPIDDEISEPDWALVEKLEEIAKADVIEEIPHPELPAAPDLESLAASEPPISREPDDVVLWESEQDAVDPNDWDVEWQTVPDEEE